MSAHLAPRPGRRRQVDSSPERRRRAVLRAVVVLGVSLFLATGLAWAAGVKPLVFTSGSMSPSIPTGSLALSRTVDPATLVEGDVVSVANDDDRVTHRVVATQQRGEETVLVLRGDANTSNDPAPYIVTEAEQVIVSVPGLGRAVSALDGKVGLAVLLVGGVLVVGVLRRPSSIRHRSRRVSAGGPVATLSIGALVASGALVLGALPTSAYWTDVATASSGTVSTVATTPAPGGATCSDTGDHVLAGWSNVGQRYRYQVSLHRLSDGAQVGNVAYVNAATTGSVASEIQRLAFGNAPTTSGQFNFTMRVRGLAAASTTWLSPTALSIPVRYTGGYAALRCGNDTATTVAITSIAQDSNIVGDYVTNVASNAIVGTGEVGATIVIRVNGQPVGQPATVSAAGTWSVPLTLTEGLVSYTATATDPYGNTATASRGVHLDTVAPAAPTVSSPCLTSTGDSAVGNAVSGVAGESWCKLTSRPYSLTYPTSTGDSGPSTGDGLLVNSAGAGFVSYTGTIPMAEVNGRTMAGRAKDLAGNLGPIVASVYYIDGTAPTATITGPTSDLGGLLRATFLSRLATLCGSSAAGCGTITDGVSGPASVEWRLQRNGSGGVNLQNVGGTWAAPVTWIPAAVAGASSRWSATVTNLDNVYDRGTRNYTLTIRNATDAAGNVATTTPSIAFGILLGI